MAIPPFIPTPARVQCPSCGMPVTVEVHSMVDGGRQPELKTQLLSGQLNVLSCPACGHRGVMSAPLLYHDGSHELLAVFVPQQADMSEPQRQKLIGDLTTRLMNSLPPDQRKGYLFQAKQYLTLPSLLDAVLIADGITPEQLEQQRTRMRLIQRLLDAMSSEDVLEVIVKENDESLDYEFFAVLSSMAEAARQDGQGPQAQQMLTLRDKLLDMTSWGKQAGRDREVLTQLGAVTSVEQLVEKLAEAEDDQLEMLVRMARPLLDYSFFQALTARLDAASKEGKKKEAQHLRARRSRLLQLTEQVDAEVQREAERATKLLRELLESEDPAAAVRQRGDEIDDMFLAVLSMNLQEAERAEASQAVGRLRVIWRAVTELMEERMPPALRFINELLAAEFPQETQSLLQKSHSQVDDELLEMMKVVADDLDQQGRNDVAKRLRDIRGQAVLMV